MSSSCGLSFHWRIAGTLACLRFAVAEDTTPRGRNLDSWFLCWYAACPAHCSFLFLPTISICCFLSSSRFACRSFILHSSTLCIFDCSSFRLTCSFLHNLLHQEANLFIEVVFDDLHHTVRAGSLIATSCQVGCVGGKCAMFWLILHHSCWSRWSDCPKLGIWPCMFGPLERPYRSRTFSKHLPSSPKLLHCLCWWNFQCFQSCHVQLRIRSLCCFFSSKGMLLSLMFVVSLCREHTCCLRVLRTCWLQSTRTICNHWTEKLRQCSHWDVTASSPICLARKSNLSNQARPTEWFCWFLSVFERMIWSLSHYSFCTPKSLKYLPLFPRVTPRLTWLVSRLDAGGWLGGSCCWHKSGSQGSSSSASFQACSWASSSATAKAASCLCSSLAVQKIQDTLDKHGWLYPLTRVANHTGVNVAQASLEWPDSPRSLPSQLPPGVRLLPQRFRR